MNLSFLTTRVGWFCMPKVVFIFRKGRREIINFVDFSATDNRGEYTA